MNAVNLGFPGICQLLDQYAWKDIYNMDETGLFFHMMSNCDLRLGLHLFLMLTLVKHFQFQADNSLATKQLEGRKQNKERLTWAFCCNGDGSDKLPLWVIGKYKNPHCFKNVNLGSMGCTYQSNAKAYMTQIIFLEWLNAFDLHVANCKVLSVFDNYNAHVPLEELPARIQLRNAHVLYLPPNMTSKIQPCDASIIHNFKAYYRRRFNCLLGLEDDIDQTEKIDMM